MTGDYNDFGSFVGGFGLKSLFPGFSRQKRENPVGQCGMLFAKSSNPQIFR